MQRAGGAAAGGWLEQEAGSRAGSRRRGQGRRGREPGGQERDAEAKQSLTRRRRREKERPPRVHLPPGLGYKLPGFPHIGLSGFL